MSDVFISYASASREVAARLAAAVERLGYSVWWDGALLPHDQYGKMIEQQLEAARCVIVLWSDEARDSRWVLAEASRALGKGKLIQGNLSARLPPLPFDQIQVVGLDGWSGTDDHPGWARIAASVHQLAGGKEAPKLGLLAQAQALPRPAPPRGWGLAAAGVLGLAALPVIAGRVLLADAQGFLRTPLTALAALLVAGALMLILPGRSAALRGGLIAAGIAAALAAIAAQAMLADRFVVSGRWSERPLVLGCGVPPPTCAALRQSGLSCASPAAMCPLDGGDQPETVLANYSFEPLELYGPRGLGRVRRWMHLAWNGLFLSLAVLGAALLAPLVSPRRAR